jgi:hypothetical protein
MLQSKKQATELEKNILLVHVLEKRLLLRFYNALLQLNIYKKSNGQGA